MDRRTALNLILNGTLAACIGPAFSQTRQGLIRIVVPYSAGGQTDSMARLFAVSIQKSLGRNVIVENRPGAAALIGTRYVQAAPPDGDTILFHNSGLVLLPMIEKS